MRRKKNWIACLLALLTAAFFSFIELPGLVADGLTFHAFDVGQGDSFLFSFPDGGTMLVDAGPRKEGKKLVRKLRDIGIRRIDILVATHPHEDHIGGMAEVLRSFPVGKVWDSGYNHGSGIQRELLAAIRRRDIRFGKPRVGFVEKRGEAVIEVLAPRGVVSESDANDNSLILRVSLGNVSFLMMGDTGEEGRARAGSLPKSTVLKVGHHGGRDGTDAALLRQVEPKIAVLTYGKGNSYGHPHRETLALLAGKRVEEYATANGDITITTDGKGYSVRQ